MSTTDLDEERVGRVARVMLGAVLHNYQKGPISRDRTLEALNALAAAAAHVIVGVGSRDDQAKAYDFFAAALSQNMEAAIEHLPGTAGANSHDGR